MRATTIAIQFCFAATLTAWPTAAAQSPSTELQAAAVTRERCVAALKAGDKGAAKVLTADGERRYRAFVASHPNDARPKVGLARLLGECGIELAGFMSKGDVFDEGRALLLQVLAADSTHWEARFALSQFYYNAPDFLGHRKDGIRELETLLRQQGDSDLFPELASPYVMLGDLYVKEKRVPDALRIWRQGQRLFPK